MFRLIIGLILGYLGYKFIKKIARLFIPPLPKSAPQEKVQAEELVQDPVCKTFIPRREALKAQHDGRDFFFCSEGCRKRFTQRRP